MTVVAGVADKALAGARYQVGQGDTSLTPISPDGLLLHAIRECILLCHPVTHSEAFTDET